jgi:hypothetical protein
MTDSKRPVAHANPSSPVHVSIDSRYSAFISNRNSGQRSRIRTSAIHGERTAHVDSREIQTCRSIETKRPPARHFTDQPAVFESVQHGPGGIRLYVELRLTVLADTAGVLIRRSISAAM